RRIGKTGIKSSGTVCGVAGALWQGKAGEIGLHGGSCVLSRHEVGNCGEFRLGQAQPKTFIAEKEKCAVSADRSAERSSKIVLTFFGLRQRWVIQIPVEPIARVEYVIPCVVKCRAMKPIGPRTCHDRDLAACSTSKFRSIG